MLTVSGFVVATMVSQPNGEYEVSIELIEGWNIIAGTMPEDGILADSEIQLSDIGAMWYYSPKSKEYIEVYPNPELSKLQQADDDIVLTSAMWIYSKKQGIFKYSTLEDYPELSQRQLFAGWNFLSITDDMTIDINSAGPEEEDRYTLNAMSGACDFTAVYAYGKDGGEVKWMDLLNNPNFMDSEPLGKELAGMGLVVKVSSDCNLGSSGGTNPPALPEGEDAECTDNDGGVEYYTNGVTFGNYHVDSHDVVYFDNSSFGEGDECCTSCDFTENVNEGVYLREGYCDSENIVRFEKYECPSGCLGGACVGEGEEGDGDELNLSGDKLQAKEFSLQIVKTYSDDDCDAFYDALLDTIYLLDGDGPVEKSSETKEILCNSHSKAFREERTYQDYLDLYEIEILEKAEYDVDYPEIESLQVFETTSDDYLFIGWETKDSQQENFVWGDMFFFMVRKTGDGWRISALSG